MPEATVYTAETKVTNFMGFHVRPVQRFAAMARLFQSDVELMVRDRKAPGASVMHLMSLGATCGDILHITASGDDSRQCRDALVFMTENRFFVEDHQDVASDEQRHLKRLAGLASCFLSEVSVRIGNESADAKDLRALQNAGITPQSDVAFTAQGPDAEQARLVLEHLAKNCYYVEDQMGK